MTGGTVLVLGAVGRNFAAGMSGGTAYVVDLPPSRVNPDMVDLEQLDAEDIDLVGLLLRQHAAETGSAVAKSLLADWNVDVALASVRFTKVMPRDYRNVLAARTRAIEQGLDIDDTIMEASRG
jgi:glutamate synthase (NADPH/NADH) large chain